MGSVIERLLSKVDVAGDDCWLWRGKLTRGYACIYVGNKKVSPAHRVTYEWAVGPVPDGHGLHHTCEVKHCVNPFHLEPLPQGEHIRRHRLPDKAHANKRARTHCKRGHEFTPENTAYRKDRHGRRCRECARRDARLHREKVRNA